MTLRLRNSFAVLVALLVLGVSSFGAACQVACVSPVQKDCCAGTHCPDAKGVHAVPDHASGVVACGDVAVFAVNPAAVGLLLPPVAMVVNPRLFVPRASAEVILPEKASRPPPRPAWSDPLFLSFRV